MVEGQFGQMWHQVAGHKDHGDSPGFLLAADGRILKNISHDARGKKEEQFYKTVFSVEEYKGLRQFIPRYFSNVQLESKEYILMEDICASFTTPCIADIKIGLSEVCSLDSEDKKMSMIKKDASTLPMLGYRFAGAKTYNQKKDTAMLLDKEWGKSFTRTNCAEKTEKFFCNGTEIRRDVVPALLRQLKDLIEYYENQRLFWLCRSSLLIVYEGADESNGKLKLIDFAHNLKQEIPSDDTQVEFGLRTLFSVLRSIQDNTTAAWTFEAPVKHDPLQL